MSTPPSHLRRVSSEEVPWEPAARQSLPSRVRVERQHGGQELDGIQVSTALSLEPEINGEGMATESTARRAGKGDLRTCCMGDTGSGEALLAACGEAAGLRQLEEGERSAIPEQCTLS